MKKLFSIMLIYATIPAAFATCSLDGLSCSIADLNSPTEKMYTSKPLIQQFSNPSTIDKKVVNKEEEQNYLRNFGQQETDYGYNASCQFGVCNQTGVPQLFPPKGERER